MNLRSASDNSRIFVCSAHGFIARAIAAPLNHVPSQDSLLNGIFDRLTAFAINCSNHFRSPSLSGWWAQMDSDHRPHAYQACALTNWAISPHSEPLVRIGKTHSSASASVLTFGQNHGFFALHGSISVPRLLWFFPAKHALRLILLWLKLSAASLFASHLLSASFATQN